MKTKLNNQKGFTIIEVLIVLAIAGLILLIVFLAVPALQRNSRNTQRKNDVGRIGGAAQEVLNNNNGDLTKLVDASIQAAVGTKLAYYTSTSVTVAAAPAAVTNGTTVDSVVVYKGGKCADIVAGGQGGITGTTRSIAIVYTVETGGGTLPVCTDS